MDLKQEYHDQIRYQIHVLSTKFVTGTFSSIYPRHLLGHFACRSFARGTASWVRHVSILYLNTFTRISHNTRLHRENSCKSVYLDRNAALSYPHQFSITLHPLPQLKDLTTTETVVRLQSCQFPKIFGCVFPCPTVMISLINECPFPSLCAGLLFFHVDFHTHTRLSFLILGPHVVFLRHSSLTFQCDSFAIRFQVHCPQNEGFLSWRKNSPKCDRVSHGVKKRAVSCRDYCVLLQLERVIPNYALFLIHILHLFYIEVYIHETYFLLRNHWYFVENHWRAGVKKCEEILHDMENRIRLLRINFPTLCETFFHAEMVV